MDQYGLQIYISREPDKEFHAVYVSVEGKLRAFWPPVAYSPHNVQPWKFVESVSRITQEYPPEYIHIIWWERVSALVYIPGFGIDTEPPNIRSLWCRCQSEEGITLLIYPAYLHNLGSSVVVKPTKGRNIGRRRMSEEGHTYHSYFHISLPWTVIYGVITLTEGRNIGRRWPSKEGWPIFLYSPIIRRSYEYVCVYVCESL